MVSAVLIAINWGVYVWAVAEQAVTEAALGYYLTPLLNVAAGMLLFGERLSRLKVLALGIAGIGVLSVALLVGSWPWFGLAVGFSFGLTRQPAKKPRSRRFRDSRQNPFCCFRSGRFTLGVGRYEVGHD